MPKDLRFAERVEQLVPRNLAVLFSMSRTLLFYQIPEMASAGRNRPHLPEKHPSDIT